jgi:hypothetical protein
MDPRGGGGIKHQVHRFRTHIPTDFTRGVPGKSTTNCTCIVRKIRFSVPPYWRRKDSIFVVASETKNPATGAGKVGSCFLPEGGREGPAQRRRRRPGGGGGGGGAERGGAAAAAEGWADLDRGRRARRGGRWREEGSARLLADNN